MTFTLRVVLFLCFVATVTSTADADVLANHTGSTDPTTEAWTPAPGTGGVTVGAIDDGGTPAWFVNDASSVSGSNFLYEHTVTGAEIASASLIGWTLSTRIRVASDDVQGSDGSPFVAYRDGVRTWQMNFGLDSSGDTFVRLYTDPTNGPVHTIAGNSNYTTFALKYDPVANNADLFVNGSEVLSDYVGDLNPQTRVIWGAGRSPDIGNGLFNDVTFSSVPEPGLFSIWLIASTGLLTVRRRRR